MINYRSLVKDGFRFLSCVKPLKLYNFLLLALSYFISKILKRPLMAGLPFSMSIEVTTFCNLRCTECPSGLRKFTRPTGRINPAFFDKIIDQVKSHLIYLTLYFQGEPYLHSQFLELVAYANKNGIYTATSTNGHYLSIEKARQTVKSGLSRLIVSLDGMDQDTYGKYRISGNVDKVKEGLRNLILAKKEVGASTPYVILQFIAFAHNKHQIEEIKAYGKEVGVDEVQIKSAQIYDFEKGSDLIIDDDAYSRYERTADGGWQIRSALPDRCWRMWSGCVITWDGKIVPCCFDKDADHRLGNLEDNSFKQVWKSDAYQKFRSALFTNRKQIDICRNCTEGLSKKKKALHEERP
jgi:radical SAM protein with 4Fe4S-binding SPASM domain